MTAIKTSQRRMAIILAGGDSGKSGRHLLHLPRVRFYAILRWAVHHRGQADKRSFVELEEVAS